MQSGNPYFSSEIAEVINQLWKNLILSKIIDDYSSHFYLMDSAA